MAKSRVDDAPLNQRAALRIPDAAQYLSISERKMRQLIADGTNILCTRKLGNARVIERSLLDRFLRELPKSKPRDRMEMFSRFEDC